MQFFGLCSLMESKWDMVESLDHQEAEMVLLLSREAVAVEIWRIQPADSLDLFPPCKPFVTYSIYA